MLLASVLDNLSHPQEPPAPLWPQHGSHSHWELPPGQAPWGDFTMVWRLTLHHHSRKVPLLSPFYR